MSKRSQSPMEQGEIEASPDFHCSPNIYLDPDDSPRTPLMSHKDKSGKSKHNEKQDSRSPDRHEETEDALSIQPPQPSHQKKDKHRHHKHGKDSHRRARDHDKYLPEGRRGRGDDHQIRKYDDKTHGKPSKKVSEVSTSSRDFSKPDREVEVLRRQKSLIERERLERLERERHRIEKEKDREYRAKMKKSEQEQGSRSDMERRPRPDWPWREDDRNRQISDELMKKRGREATRKGRQRSRTRSRSPIQPLIPSKELIKDVRQNVKELRREELGQIQRHELWSSKDSKQRTDQSLDRYSDQEPYLRNKELYGGFGKHSASAHVDPVEQNQEDNSEISDRSDSEDDDNRDHGRGNSEHAGHSSGSPNGSDISSASNASGSKSDRSGSPAAGIESRHNSPRDDLRSKFDDDKHTNSGTRESENSESEYEEDRGERNNQYLDESPILSSPESEPQLPPYFPALQGCRNVEEFHCLNRIEEGTYGVVYRAVDLKMEEVVALKRLKMEKEKEGFPITSLREINTLLKAQHQNVVTVREIVVGSNMDKIYIVMDYVEHDLKSLMEYMKEPFSIGEVKTLLLQLLRGVAHLHDNWIIHRDLKASNLLLSHKGILKIGDFGLAREYGSPLRPYTPIVVTLWYRAPELLLGTKQYSTPIDLWSVGCIFAEFLTRKPLFPGKSEIDQLNKIFKELGTPNEKIWPGVNELPAMKKCTFTEYPYNQLQAKFKNLLTAKGLDLLNRFLTYNPEKRATAEDAKKHEFFAESPLPVDPSMFPTWPAKSEQSRTRTHGNSPKPPSGGKAYAKLLADDEEYGARFHIGAPALGDSTKSTFALKFGAI